METRKPRGSSVPPSRPTGFSSYPFLLLLISFLVGCGAPGEPQPPSPIVPVAVTDLSARQIGDAVQLTFSLPTKTVTGDRLTEPPALEILRGTPKQDGSVDMKSFRAVQTIPGALVNRYISDGHVQLIDLISLAEARAHPGGAFFYRVRTRASRKRASPDSNIATVQVFPAPERVASIQTTVTDSAIELSWSAPTRTSAGELLGGISEYHVYRGEIDPSSAEAAAKDLSQAKWKVPLVLTGRSETTIYRDTAFEFGKIYAYTVRSVILAGGNQLESADSVPVIVTPQDTFPPAPPQGLVAAVVTPPGAPVEVDLSWSMNTETDLAGYRVYRSEQQDTKGHIVTPDLLLAPAYRDTSVLLGHRYWYSVTAVDRAGNESVPNTAIMVEVEQPSSSPPASGKGFQERTD